MVRFIQISLFVRLAYTHRLWYTAMSSSYVEDVPHLSFKSQADEKRCEKNITSCRIKHHGKRQEFPAISILSEHTSANKE